MKSNSVLQLARLIVPGLALAAAACSPQELPPARPPMAMHHLIMMTDGVPWEVMDSLHRAGHFQAFNAPSQLVSPFPSLTGVAFRDIWQEDLAPGYEDKYYDTKQNRMTGGLLDHMFKPAEHLGFHRKVEVEANAFTTGLAYVTPVPMSQLELRAVRSRIAARARFDTTVVAYIVTTDAIAHRASRQELVNYLLQIDAMLAGLRRENPTLRITLFSDHGNDFVTTRRVQLEDGVRQAGFRQVNKITGPNDVVLPKFGLVGSAFLYGSPHAEPRLAQALRAVDGVELVMFEDALERIHVWSRDGEAIVESDSLRTWYRYTAVSGDPLALLPALTAMKAKGQADAGGAASDSAWLTASLRTPYIDALRRITIGMRSSVANPASVVVSFAPGYHFGDVAASRLVKVTGTHGSLRTTSSLAYFMSTSARPPALLRSDRVLPYVAGGT
ncbi:MAG: hypothetical protein ABIS27_07060 [Longimicrobiales bacterium]